MDTSRVEYITKVTIARTNLHTERQKRRFEVRITSDADLDHTTISRLAQLAAEKLDVDPSHVTVVVPSAVDPEVIRGLVANAGAALRERLDSAKPDSGGEIAVTFQHEPPMVVVSSG